MIFQAKYERQHREDLSKKGELGKREDIGSRLGFHFKLTKKESVQKLQEDEDPELKKMAFNWKSGGEVSSESEAEEKLKQQEGEQFATLQKIKTLEMKKQIKKEKNKIKQMIQKQKQNKKIQKKERIKSQEQLKPKKQFQTHNNELIRDPCKKKIKEKVSLKQGKKKIPKTEINENKIQKEVKSQSKTHKKENSCKSCNSEQVHLCSDDSEKAHLYSDDSEQEVKTRRGGWPASPGGGLKGGAGAGVWSSNVSTLQTIVRVCLCLCA